MKINHEQLLMQDMMLYVVSQPTKSGYFFLEQHRRQNLDIKLNLYVDKRKRQILLRGVIKPTEMV